MIWQWVLLMLGPKTTEGFLESLPDGGQEMSFEAVDCTNPARFRASNLRTVCDQQGPNWSGKTEVQAALLQRLDQRTIRAVRCEQRISLYDVVCSVWSHSKALGSPDIERREPFDAHKCRRTVDRKTYISTSGIPYAIDLNTEVQFKSVIAGSLTPTADDVTCIGGARKIGKVFHRDVVTMATTTVLLKEVILEYDSTTNTLKDLDLLIDIDPTCLDRKQCTDSGLGYVITEGTNTCPFGLLREGVIEGVNVPVPTGPPVRGLLSRKYKYLLRVDGRTQDYPGCGELPTPRATNHPNVYVMLLNEGQTVTPIIQAVSGRDVDLELEISTSEAFLEYRFIEMSRNYLTGILEALCRLSTASLPELTPSPLHSNRYLHISGEVISEIECKTTKVTAILGEQIVPWCTRDLFPVHYKGNDVFLQAKTRLIVPEVVPVHVNCTPMDRPIFQTENGLFVTADPEVRTVSMDIDQDSSLNIFSYMGNSTMTEDDWGASLLYDHEVMQELESTIHFGLTKTKVVKSLTQAYCSGGTCGTYSPGTDSGFDPTKLLEAAEDYMNPMTKLYNILVQIGSICSILVAIYVIIMIAKWAMGRFCPSVSLGMPKWIRRWIRQANRTPLSDARMSRLQRLADDARMHEDVMFHNLPQAPMLENPTIIAVNPPTTNTGYPHYPVNNLDKAREAMHNL